jgi:hypothetical protein
MAKKNSKKKEVVKKANAKSATPSKKTSKKGTAVKKIAPAKKVVAKSKPVPKKVVKKVITKPVAAKKAVKPTVKAKISPAPKAKTPVVKAVTKPVAKATIVAAKVALKPEIEKVKGKSRARKIKAEPQPKAEIKTRPIVQKNLAKPVANNNKRPEIIVPKIAKPIQIEAKDRMLIKKQLLTKCLDIQTFIISNAKKAMDDAQQSANEEKNSNEDMSDSFRETMHATRDVYARQVQEGINTLGLLNRIMIKPIEVVKFGTVVITDFQNYFISAGLGEVKIDDKNFVTVSTLTPLYQILSEKKKGDLFMFLDRKYRILDVF